MFSVSDALPKSLFVRQIRTAPERSASLVALRMWGQNGQRLAVGRLHLRACALSNHAKMQFQVALSVQFPRGLKDKQTQSKAISALPPDLPLFTGE